ncbi:hypothetical protein MM236_19280 [Belliella sp. DSM 107340]|uniref:Uncharacterized protein n=1 Tax=Belliella calami TaxID=2923436 RepID=A0ABS9UU47_9BACT|nr:hypothetical protein [Belliella calami]MCH7400145.1 hypothetical protein [Belliella calami]
MRKFRKVKGSELAESYKKGWEMAINSLEKANSNDKESPIFIIRPKNQKLFA